MEDSELEQIRQARLQQLKAQSAGSPDGEASQAEQQQQQEAARKNILDQILHPDAADRLGRIRLVKQERAAEVEAQLIMLARTGQLREKVTEAQLKDLLEAVAEKRKEVEKVVVSRRKGWDADDDLDDLLGPSDP